jgi:hypothetical protein
MSNRWSGLPRTKATARPSQAEVDIALGIVRGKVPGSVTHRDDGMTEVRGNGKWLLMPRSRFDEITNPSDVHIGIRINNP